MTEFLCQNGIWNCPTAPVQKLSSPGVMPRELAEEAYKEYVAKFGRSQSLDRLNERGGFASDELAILLYYRIKRLESMLHVEISQLDAWASESVSGGWSTHQVDPMRRRADELRRQGGW